MMRTIEFRLVNVGAGMVQRGAGVGADEFLCRRCVLYPQHYLEAGFDQGGTMPFMRA